MKVIVRHVKHKTLGTIAASAAHTTRRRPTPNADPSKPAPEVWHGSDSPEADVRRMLPEKRRKNAVLALEYVLTASPEFFSTVPETEWRGYLRQQLAMLQDYYRPENVVSATLHLDEKTPHLAVYVVPLVDGKLNARALVGTREACSIIQDLAGEAGGDYGLQRGKRGSKARHQDVQRFYSEIEPSARAAVAATARLAAQAADLEKKEVELSERRRALEADVVTMLKERDRLSLLAQALSPEEVELAATRLAVAVGNQTNAARGQPGPVRPVSGVRRPMPGPRL